MYAYINYIICFRYTLRGSGNMKIWLEGNEMQQIRLCLKLYVQPFQFLVVMKRYT
jgi:hypothetical protein